MKIRIFIFAGTSITDANEVAKMLNISVATALRIIDDFLRLEILIEITGFKRSRMFTFDNYIKLFR